MKKIELTKKIIPMYYELVNNIVKNNKTHYWIKGGRGSTKSSFISIMILILIINNEKVHACIFRKVGENLKNSVYNQMLWAIDQLELTELFKIYKSPLKLIYIPTGQTISFLGCDDPQKIKGVTVPFGYIGVTWFEEVDQFHGMEEIRTVLQSTNRGGSNFWNFYSFNPPKNINNWVNKIEHDKRDDTIVTHSTYLDVPQHWLGERFFYEAETLKNINERSYNHEYLGMSTGTGTNIFENLAIKDITEEEEYLYDRIYRGLDFGFYPDPTAYIECGYNSKDKTLIILDEMVGYKMDNETLADKLKEKNIGQNEIICDSASPKDIYTLKQYGIKAVPATKRSKTADRNFSFKFLQTLSKIIVDPNKTPNIYKELIEFEYQKNKNGEIIEGYPDGNDHCIDSLRYSLNRIWIKGG